MFFGDYDWQPDKLIMALNPSSKESSMSEKTDLWELTFKEFYKSEESVVTENNNNTGNDNTINNKTETPLQKYIPNSDSDLKRRLPTVLIIGFSKCGTHALRTFLSLHPRLVVHDVELGFFDSQYEKGLEWYRQQMPLSYSNQITIEKTPAYIQSNEALKRIHGVNPDAKLIILVRHPLVRVQSHYAREVWQNKDFNKTLTQYINDLKMTSLLRMGSFAPYIRGVYDCFKKDQVLILDGELLIRKPTPVLQECEKFLGIEHLFRSDFFVFDKEKGFNCINTSLPFFKALIERNVKMKMETGCFTGAKGRPHPDLSKSMQQRLIKLFRPTTEDLFDILGRRLNWDGFK